MNKNNCVFAFLIFILLLVSACNKSGASAGTAPRTPFIGGTSGLTLNFEKDSPPPEVTDDGSFPFGAILRIKNDGETKIDKGDVKINLVGFDPNDFGKNFADLSGIEPADSLESKRKDAEGNTIEGTTTFATFPRDGDFVPNKFNGNTEFTFRADVCYFYETQANTKMCALRDMLNVRENSICKPNGAKTVYSSSAPVQVANFRQSVVGNNKLTFSFDIVLSGNVDVFFDKTAETTPKSGFDVACPRDPRARRQNENNVQVEITEIPNDPIIQTLNCGGLDEDGKKGVVKLVSGRRTITCTIELATGRADLEKVVGINLKYNVLDNKETKVLVKHLASS